MYLRTLAFPLPILITAALHAQPFAIGHTSVVFFDTLRARSIPVELYYPADADGEDVPAASGVFPVLAMGHGFVMNVPSYANIWSRFVPEGYIVALPTTEGGFAPDHAAFGADLAFIPGAVQFLGSEPASPVFGSVGPQSALMGHSMGGGASMLGAAGNPSINALVNFAAAETNPSAIAAATSVGAPSLMFAASEDCVAPIADHQQPMYDALTVDCRALVTVTGGGHCYFADANFNCSFGEFTCGPDLTITREQQQDVVGDLTLLWLDHFLKNDVAALAVFSDSLLTTTRATSQFSCLSTGVFDPTGTTQAPRYDAGTDQIFFSEVEGGTQVDLFDLSGRRSLQGRLGPDGRIAAGSLSTGTYLWTLTSNAFPHSGRLVVVR